MAAFGCRIFLNLNELLRAGARAHVIGGPCRWNYASYLPLLEHIDALSSAWPGAVFGFGLLHFQSTVPSPHIAVSCTMPTTTYARKLESPRWAKGMRRISSRYREDFIRPECKEAETSV
jgi:hypothetical protein